jgi:hypothetical protein
MSDAGPTADLPPPTRSGRLLALVRKLVDYGKQLAENLRGRPAPNDARDLARNFGTNDIALILARIAQGLLRARFLEAKITSNASRIDAAPQPKPAPSPSKPRAVRLAAQLRTAKSQPTDTASVIANLPTPDQIAAKIRRQTIGAVLADICRDLGVPPTHPLWDELYRVIKEYGGNSSRLHFEWLEQAFPIRHILARRKEGPQTPPHSASTGPPSAIPA